MLTNLIITNATEIERLKKDIATEAYIDEYYRILNVPNVGNVTAIDNPFKQALFAHWIRGTADFAKFKAKYKALANASNATTAAAAAKSKKTVHVVISSGNLTEIRDKFGLNPITVQLNASERATVLVPRNLQLALFNEWPEKNRVVYLLGKFAKDLDLTTNIVQNGAQLVLRPPNPPAEGHQNGGYRYEKYGMKETFVKLIAETHKSAFFQWPCPFPVFPLVASHCRAVNVNITFLLHSNPRVKRNFLSLFENLLVYRLQFNDAFVITSLE